MSIVKKAAKTSLVLFSAFVILLVCGVGYVYVNMGSLAKQLTESVASTALGVPVTIGKMDISLDENKVVVSNILISNPDGYKKENAVSIDTVTVAAESFSKTLLSFARVEVDGTNVNLEVNQNGTNLGDLQANIAKIQGQSQDKKMATDMKVIVKKFSLTKAQLNPSITLLDKDLAFITVPDVILNDIGKKENGILAQEAVAQIMGATLSQFNRAANGAGFLEGLPLDLLNQMGVSTVDVFQKNLKESFDKEVEGFKKGVDGLKGLFE